MDNRLDFITEFEDGTVDKMTELRKKFIELDKELLELWKPPCQPASQRAFSIARTNLETALQYGIKGLCLKYEKDKS